LILYKNILSITLLFIILTGCNVEGEPGIQGTIADKDRNKLLVIVGLPQEQEAYDIQQILDTGDFPEAYWIETSAFHNFKIGDQVEVWFSYTQDSYPAQTKAEKIKKLKH